MPDFDRLPLEIQQSTRAVLWNYETRDGKRTKVPYCPDRPTDRAAVDNPATWGAFATARAAVEDGKADGAGIVLGDGLTGIDLDQCRQPETGTLTLEAVGILQALESYAEASPSGTGVHVLVHGTLPPGRRRKGPVEMYSDGRYFTVTGQHLDGTPTTIHARDDALAALHTRIFHVSEPAPILPRNEPSAPTDADAEDLLLLTRARVARNGQKFSALWAGDLSAYGSASEADQALCNLLAFWTANDAGRMDRLFRRSGLMRDKWDTRRGDRTYGALTIATAITGCRAPAPTSTADAGELELTSLETLMAEPDDALDWLVQERFAYGSVNLLAGRPKAGKSTLARALALCVARGEPWLGHRCHPGRVVYLALEDKRSEVRRHLRAMGATGTEPIRFLIGRAPVNLLTQLSTLVLAGDMIDLLIIDTAQRLLAVKDSNDYAIVTAAFEPVLALARTHGTCIVLLHHAGKADRAGIEQVMGSTAWAASVDNVLLLSRSERYRLLSSVQRIGPDLDETVVLMDEASGDVRFGGSRYLVDLATIEQALADVVADAGDSGLRQDELLLGVEARRELKLKALRQLATRPDIERTGAGTRNHPFRYRHLREPEITNRDRSISSSLVPLRDRELEMTDRDRSTPMRVNASSRGSAGSRHERRPA